MQGMHALLIEGFAYTNRFTINVPDRSVLCSVMPAFPTKRVLSSCFFFLLAHQTDLLPFQCQCIGKSKGSLRYSVQQGSYMNNHYVHRAWVLFNGQVNVLINLCTSFYIQFWLNLILLSDKSKTICTTVTSSIYFEVFKLFSQTKYDATYKWCINRLL